MASSENDSDHEERSRAKRINARGTVWQGRNDKLRPDGSPFEMPQRIREAPNERQAPRQDGVAAVELPRLDPEHPLLRLDSLVPGNNVDVLATPGTRQAVARIAASASWRDILRCYPEPRKAPDGAGEEEDENEMNAQRATAMSRFEGTHIASRGTKAISPEEQALVDGGLRELNVDVREDLGLMTFNYAGTDSKRTRTRTLLIVPTSGAMSVEAAARSSPTHQ